MGSVLDAFDSCRILLRSKNVAEYIPEIVVIGDQSSGKSSLLETISGINLPRGDGMITKVPLELQLRQNKHKQQTAKIFYWSKEEEIQDLAKIPQHVLDAQETIIGGKNEKDVKDDVIRLTITSPNLPNLTLTDQPGLIQNVAPGQPQDLPERIKKLTEKHTQGESKVILCVVPGNVDPSTCLALNIAEKQDAENQRTICVITKVDMGLKSEFNINSVVEHLEQKGCEYVAVRNRTSREVEGGLSVQELRKIEEKMINEELQGIIPLECCGVGSLISRLVNIQRSILGGSLENVKQKVEEELQKVEENLENLPPSVRNESQAWNMVQNKSKQVSQELSCIATKPSRYNYTSIVIENVQYTTSAILEKEFKNYLQNLEESLENPLFLDSDEISQIIALSKPFAGTQLPNFPIYSVPLSLYELFLWSTLEEPAQKLINQIHEKNEEILLEIVEVQSEKFPKLKNFLQKSVKDLMKDVKKEVNKKLDLLIELEREPYTQDTSYMNDIKRWTELVSSTKEEKVNQENETNTSTQKTCTIPFGIGSMLPELGTSWEKQAGDLVNFVEKNPTNDNLQALDIMISLAAISGVLFRRFVDNLCQRLRYMYLTELPKKFVENCQIREERAYDMLRNERVEQQRRKLEKDKKNYQEALEKLRNCYF
eukprot:TRINITY_DN13045_c0_g2_i6.p2 TRINITY_DN13045_c0_g2~~TRINITY_DN13045_c0_g2_i6.p2  ORF type:complete len:656 (-),score=120.93 TRINITY_DN13045_c0_g2_i6:1132-3099(-)